MSNSPITLTEEKVRELYMEFATVSEDTLSSETHRSELADKFGVNAVTIANQLRWFKDFMRRNGDLDAFFAGSSRADAVQRIKREMVTPETKAIVGPGKGSMTDRQKRAARLQIAAAMYCYRCKIKQAEKDIEQRAHELSVAMQNATGARLKNLLSQMTKLSASQEAHEAEGHKLRALLPFSFDPLMQGEPDLGKICLALGVKFDDILGMVMERNPAPFIIAEEKARQVHAQQDESEFTAEERKREQARRDLLPAQLL